MARTGLSGWGISLISIMMVLTLAACSGFEEQLIYNDAQRAHNKKDFKTAIKLYRKLLDSDPHDKIHPENAILRYDLGVAYIDSGDRPKAIEQVKELKRMKREDLADQLEKLLDIDNTL